MSIDIAVVGIQPVGHRIAHRMRAQAEASGLGSRSLTLSLAPLDRPITDPIRPAAGADVLNIAFWQPLIYIGPRHRLGGRGCSACLLTRLAATRHGPELDPFGTVRVSEHQRADPPIPSGRIDVIASLASALLAAPDDSLPETFVLHARTGDVTRETLLQVGDCPACGPEPVATLPHFAPPTKAPERRSRRPAEELAAQLDEIYAQPHLGVVREIMQDLQAPAATTTAEMRHGTLRADATIGRSHNFVSSRAIATLEAMERYCGLRTDVLREAVKASFHELADRALDPRSLGLYPKSSYRMDDFPFRPFDADRPLSWIPGYSFARNGTLLVPALAAFYSLRATLGDALLGESSNGCALGESLEDAALHAVLELVERDAFLMAWYRRLSLPELSLASMPHFVRRLVAKIELITGFEIRVFISTMEHGVPSVVAIGESRRPDGPSVLVSAGAHPSLAAATASALYELAGLVLRVQHRFEEKRSSALAMLADPDLVRTIEDHPLVNCLPEARGRFSFLLDHTHDKQSLADLPPPADLVEGDERQRLDAIARRLLAIGLDLILVDQTCSELHPAGLHCVKAIVPGLLPMTFGHRFRRIDLPRLTKHLDEGANPSVLPHPFP